MNTAIIVAAGSGQRFNSDTPKQFVPLLGKPLIFHTLEKFESCDRIDGIVLVLSDECRELFESSNLKSEITKLRSVVTGGSTRAESVRNGLSTLDANDGDIVAVHDGARPLVTVDEIARTVEKAAETGAACLVAPVTDTIKTIRGDEIAGTLERDKLRRALTPQAFKFEVLKRAFEQSDLSEAVTDECYLVEKLGHPIVFVEGSSRNIKVTRPEDLVFAEALLSAGVSSPHVSKVST
ncbi:MAG: 2-C-methyl-D-erythritol 4-phosphate cytidylyltransferase [Pyrinomonadaceae bacterium]